MIYIFDSQLELEEELDEDFDADDEHVVDDDDDELDELDLFFMFEVLFIGLDRLLDLILNYRLKEFFFLNYINNWQNKDVIIRTKKMKM